MIWQVIKNRVLLWLRRIVTYGLYSVLVFFVLGFGILQIPRVQEALLSKLMERFSTVSGFDVKFDSFYFLWYDRLEITGLHITDPEKNSLIQAGRLFVNFKLATLYNKGDINLDAVALQEGAVNLVTIPATDSTKELNIDVFIAAIGKQLGSGKSGGGGGAKVSIAEVIVEESRFSLHQPDKDSVSGFDPNHFKLAVDAGSLNGFQVIGDTIQFNLESLNVKEEKTKLAITNFRTYFRISQTSMEFLGLNLKCNQSFVSDTIIFKYASQKSLSDFNNKVTIDAKFRNTLLHPADISFFTRGLETWKSPVLLNGHFQGKVNHFSFRPMRIDLGNSHVIGSLEMDGLPSIQETFINLKLKPSIIYGLDIEFLLPNYISRNLTPLNKITVQGNFLGFVNDFVANGDFDTRFGQVKSDINYKILESNVTESSYRGNLTLNDFKLGQFLKDTLNFQNVDFRGSINGKGFSREAADFILVGEIPEIGIRNYNYVNIKSNARFAKQFFNGNLTIDDPNLQFSMKGSIDLRKGKDLINIKANLDTAILHELKLSKEKIFLQTNLDIDSRGLELDSITGSATFRKTRVQFRDESIQLDSIHLISAHDGMERSLTLRSSTADLSLTGQFYYSTLFHDIQKIVVEFLLNLKNDPTAIKEYYASKPATEQTYKADINIDVHDANPIFQVLDLDLYASPETHIQGEFSNSTVSLLTVYTRVDTFIVGGKSFVDNELEFHGSKVRDSTQVLAQLTVTSARQDFSEKLATRSLFLEGIWNLDHIDLSLDADQVDVNNNLRLKAEIDFLSDSTKIKILPSTIQILGQNWSTHRSNYMLVKGDEWSFHDVGFFQENQSIKADGEISHDSTRSLKIDIRNLELSLLNFFSTEKFQGRLNAVVIQRDLYNDLFIENELHVDSLKVNNFLVGEIKGNNTRDPSSQHFNIGFTVDRLANRIVDVRGFYDPNDKVSPLHTKATLVKANLKLLEPVVKDLFSKLDGTLTGEYDITGSFLKPEINGSAKIEGGQLLINYLKTLYKVSGTLQLAPNKIAFKDFVLTDGFRNRGTIDGDILHRNFRSMYVNLDAAFTNFHLLNTNQKDNDLFYGQAFGTGTLSILGPVSNLKISATARTNKNTRISLPIGSVNSSQDKKEFIQFVNFTEEVKTKKQVAAKKRELSGLTLDLNIDVTPDAYTELIFDIKSGDIIRGRGRGDLRLQVDTKGEFNMFGRLDFTEGAYNFTLYDIINKEFQIKPGSSISWYGDPYEANLNITAGYRQVTSMAPILSDQSVINDQNIRRKYPVEVLLKLEGLMLAPTIAFDLQAKDLPDNVVTSDGKSVRLRFEFNAFKSKLDERELQLQVFSLIILRKLSPPDAFALSSGSIYNSVSELLSNQLSYWLSQVDQNLEVDLDLGTLDQEAFNTFQLRLSYSFLNGRLRVSKDGNFGGSQVNRSELATIAGDWTVDYLLTPDGKFKVKMYSRSSVNQLQSSINTQTASVQTGTSFLYTENFNEFKDLLKSSHDKRRKELEQNPEAEGEEKEEKKGN